jgi:hypothetical protein
MLAICLEQLPLWIVLVTGLVVACARHRHHRKSTCLIVSAILLRLVADIASTVAAVVTGSIIGREIVELFRDKTAENTEMAVNRITPIANIANTVTGISTILSALALALILWTALRRHIPDGENARDET